MAKAFGFVILGFIALITIPICVGIAGGVFGLIFGLIGAIFGIVFGLIGAIFSGIGWIISSFFHLLFGWHSDFGFHHSHWHFNGYLFAAIVVLIIALAVRKKGA